MYKRSRDKIPHIFRYDKKRRVVSFKFWHLYSPGETPCFTLVGSNISKCCGEENNLSAFGVRCWKIKLAGGNLGCSASKSLEFNMKV
jgi:hypothetical protein